MSEENEKYDDRSESLVCKTFEEMKLKPSVLRGIFSFGFEKPSHIQQRAIVPFFEGRDIIVQAQSGTGKTATFSISLLQIMDEYMLDDIQTVILSPTRELAQQTYSIIKNIGKYTPFKFILLVGGNPKQRDIENLGYRPNCIIGTPGRINDLIRNSYIRLNNAKCIVLDEADELISSTFESQVRQLVSSIGENTQIGLYSATMTPEKLKITECFMRDPINILVKTEELTLEGIQQYYINVLKDEWKFETLCDLYGAIVIYQLIIYCNSRKKVEFLQRQLTHEGFAVSSMHGDNTPQERCETMKNFRIGETRILITTDLLARGIDVQQVSMVINYDIPNNFENYLHRIGRSGRFGRKGIALNFISERDVEQLKRIENYYHTEIKELPEDFTEKFKC